MQRINNAFDHLLSVADAAISFFTSSHFTTIKLARDRDRRNGGSRESKHEQICAYPAVKSPFQMIQQACFYGLLLPHTLSFITNALAAKLERWDKRSYLWLRVSAGIYLPNSAPIDSEEFISMVTQAHKFSFAPPRQGYCCYQGTGDWTLA